MTSRQKGEIKYIKDRMDILHCSNAFNVTIIYCGTVPKDDQGIIQYFLQKYSLISNRILCHKA